MIVRPVAAGDFDQWVVLWEGYNAFYEREIPRAVTEATWAGFLDDDDPLHALVVEQDARLLGTGHYLLHASTATTRQVCYLQDLYVVEDVRGRGVGRTLIEAIAGRAEVAGAVQLYWITHHTNPARVLYDRVADDSGFVVYRRPLQPEPQAPTDAAPSGNADASRR